jgi:hypothetical protein
MKISKLVAESMIIVFVLNVALWCPNYKALIHILSTTKSYKIECKSQRESNKN